jgi:SAM-dependent methyltransferase
MDFQRLKRRIPHWGRIVMDRDIASFLDVLPAAELDVLEISGWARDKHPWKSYRATDFGSFDLCTTKPLDAEYDIVFCEQVLEHVVDPVQAVKNIYQLLRPGGHAIVSVPFMVRYHPEPGDYWRFSADGLKILLSGGGFDVLKVDDWGNRLVVVANLWRWFPYIPILCPLYRNPKMPLLVWAFVHKPRSAKGSTSQRQTDHETSHANGAPA